MLRSRVRLAIPVPIRDGYNPEPRHTLGKGKDFWPGMFAVGYVPAMRGWLDTLCFHMKKWGAKTCRFADNFMGARPKESLYRLRRLVAHDGHYPIVLDNCFIAPSAVVIGDVHVGRKATVGYNTIVRGDLGKVIIGESSVINDKAVVIGPSSIGKWTTIDPMTVIDQADVAACSMVGAGSIVMRGARIESNSILCSASILQAGATIPSGEIWAGSPAEKLGELAPEEKEYIIKAAKHMVLINLEHSDSWELTWEEMDNYRIAKEHWAIWAEGMYERRAKASYVRHGPREVGRSAPNQMDVLGERMVQYESGQPGSY